MYQPHFPYVISLRSSINHHECLCKEIGLLKASDSNNQREYEEKTFWHKNYSIQKVGWSEKTEWDFFSPINVVLLRCEDSSNMNSLRSPGFLVQQLHATCEQLVKMCWWCDWRIKVCHCVVYTMLWEPRITVFTAVICTQIGCENSYCTWYLVLALHHNFTILSSNLSIYVKCWSVPFFSFLK